MRANTFDVVEKLVTEKDVGVSGVLFALMAVMQNVVEDSDIGFRDKALAAKWTKGRDIIRKAIADLPKSPGIK